MKSTRYNAQKVLELIRSLSQPVTWGELVAHADATTPREITQLRQVLRGLERHDELKRSVEGGYYLEPVGEVLVGRVQGRGRKMTVAGVEINNASKVPLRAGDEVSYAIVDDEARIQDVLAFNPEPIAGVLQWQGRYPYVEAIGALRGKISIADRPAADHGDTVAVHIIGRDRRGLVGRVVERLEREEVLDQAISTALVAHEIPHEWPEAVTVAATKLPKSVPANRFPHRQDLTQMPLVTIDGETAKDFDDAVFAQSNKQGWRLVVAIADVAHYVKPGSALDQEAVARGTSAYFPERVVPMLPEAISNGLCSLRPTTPRLALVCDMQVDRVGEVVKHDFYEAVIYSHARLTYNQVQKFLDQPKSAQVLDLAPEHLDAVSHSILALGELFQAFNKARVKRGALDFPTHEGAIRIDGGRISEITPVQRLQAHQLIEEAMIAANVCAAEFLEKCGLGGLYRVHEPPDLMRLEDLRQSLAFVGVRLPRGDLVPAQLQQALSSLPATANSWLYGQLALRTMKQAIYTPTNQGHYGLALERYMHFTSPIRRYPDLVVHRLIKAQIAKRQKNKKVPTIPTFDEIQWLGETCSNNERRAESAGWMVDGWLKCDYLMDRVGDTFEGTIAAVTDFGLFIELEGYFIQGLMHISNLGGDYFVYNAGNQSLVGERSGRRFSMGDSLKVVIKQIQPAQGQIDLILPSRGPNSRGSESRRKHGRKKR